MPHTFTNLITHVIFGTKDRVPELDVNLRPQLHAYVGGIIREIGGTPLIVNGVADHLHLLIGLPPAIALADAVRVLKANSSRWVHETRRRPFTWQSGYGAFSVSQSNVQAVSRYIARQEEHHRKVTFQEEDVAFLKRSGIKFDGRFIWS